MEGLVFNIQRFTVNDGPGIRSTVFFKGCPLSCCWCHNPESQGGFPEKSTTILKVGSRKFTEEVITGKLMTVSDIVLELERDRVFYDESGGGVTISGGEPCFQSAFLLELLIELKNRGIHVALDTCGYTSWEALSSTVDYVDLYLYDLKIMDEELHKKYTGVSNKLILGNIQKLADSGKQIIVRVPVIPGINDSDRDFGALLEFLLPMQANLREINLLPYHAAAENKYKRFRKENFMQKVKSTPREMLLAQKTQLEAKGFIVKIGG